MQRDEPSSSIQGGHQTASWSISSPGHLSKVGLHTFADPRKGGGKRNKQTTKDLVKLQAEFLGCDFLASLVCF